MAVDIIVAARITEKNESLMVRLGTFLPAIKLMHNHTSSVRIRNTIPEFSNVPRIVRSDRAKAPSPF